MCVTHTSAHAHTHTNTHTQRKGDKETQKIEHTRVHAHVCTSKSFLWSGLTYYECTSHTRLASILGHATLPMQGHAGKIASKLSDVNQLNKGHVHSCSFGPLRGSKTLRALP